MLLSAAFHGRSVGAGFPMTSGSWAGASATSELAESFTNSSSNPITEQIRLISQIDFTNVRPTKESSRQFYKNVSVEVM